MMQELRAALYTLLSGAGLKDDTSTACGVFEHVSEATKPAMPYLVIEDTTSEPWDTDTSDGADTSTVLRVFHNKRGAKAVAHIQDQVASLLRERTLTVAGSTVVTVEAVAMETERGSDGATREGVIRVRVLLDDITPSTT